ncbi:MAG: cupin domain-containing protein [Vicinamibacterales bacterium]
MSDTWLLPDAIRDPQTITAQWDPLRGRLIDGLRIREVRAVPKGNGRLTEIFRRDWQLDALPVDQVFEVELLPGGISAWHAHEHTTDRLFVASGAARIVLYDARPGSPTHGVVNELKFGEHRPALVLVPPRVWHGVQNIGSAPARILNLVDRAYCYESPDHWRIPSDSPHVPYTFPR